MPQIYRLESPESIKLAAIAIVFDPDRPAIKLQWESGAPLSGHDALQLAKDCAARALDHLVRSGRSSEANSTNWPSVVAACQRHISDWSDKLKASLYAASDSETPGGGGERRLS